ncbi:MAG: uroporphyrinogen decarboxylase family protein [Candidatus Helarchaeota archaeon]
MGLLEYAQKKVLQDNPRSINFALKRVYAAFKLKTPDRIPICGIAGDAFPARYVGITPREYLYNIDGKGLEAHYKFIKDFYDFDLVFPTALFGCGIGKILEAMGIKFIKLPGKDIDEMSFYQFDEREVIKDPNDLKNINLKYFNEMVMPEILEIALPKKQRSKTTKSMTKIGNMAMKFFFRYMHHLDRTEAMGVPMIIGGQGIQPFDIVCLFFRGLMKISGDIRRYPDDIRKLCDKLAKPLLNSFIISVKAFQKIREIPSEYNIDPDLFIDEKSRKMNIRKSLFFVCERAFMMNPRQFEKIAFPSLNYVIKGLCDNGLTPILQFEQDVTHLLPIIRKLPGPGKCVFSCDASDIQKAKEILGDHMCIIGNVPLSLFTVGTPNDIDKYVKNLVDTVGKEPGYIIGPALSIPGESKPENVKAFLNAALKYGKLS